MKYFKFGKSILSWIDLFYHNSELAVRQARNVTQVFCMEHGCKQGDPLSSYIFLFCVEILAARIRQNKNIIGITINEEEYKLSQFADDTSCFLDGSDSSLNETLNELAYFARISGLKINFDKTYVIWIGSKKYSTQSIKTKWKLNWGSNRFRMLGILFDTDLSEMDRLNYQYKLIKIKKLISSWQKRYITPIGRITVIKSILISQLNHLFLALPNPADSIILELERLIYSFLWQGQPRIKRKVISKDYQDGGLKMININAFISALKSTWIKRTILNDKSKLHNIVKMYIDLNQFGCCGALYAKRKIPTLTNLFWKDVLKAHVELQRTSVQTNYTIENLLSSSIYYNENIIIGSGTHFVKHWYHNGLNYINDMINIDGTFHTLQELNHTYNINMNFLQYLSITTSIKNLIRNTQNDEINIKLPLPLIPHSIEMYIMNKKGAKMMYSLLNTNNEKPTSQGLWNNKYKINNNEWEQIYNWPFAITNNVSLQWFQYRINHNILATNSYLHKIKVLSNSSCTFCKAYPETITHILWDCKVTQILINRFKDWFKENNIKSNMEEKTYIFGFSDENKPDMIQLIHLELKYYLYYCRCSKQIPNIETLKLRVQLLLKTNRGISIMKGKLDSFIKSIELFNFIL